jgi:hypothetical protein
MQSESSAPKAVVSGWSGVVQSMDTNKMVTVLSMCRRTYPHLQRSRPMQRRSSASVRFHSVIVNNVMRISFLDLGVLGATLMQNPDAVRVGQEDQTAPVVAIDCSDTVELAGDFGIPRI